MNSRFSFFFFLIAASMVLHWGTSPSFAEEKTFAWNAKTDVPLLVLGTGVSLWGFLRYADMEPRRDLPDKSELLPWDRPFAGNKNKVTDRISDWMSLGILLPFAWEGYNWATDKSDAGEVCVFLLSAVEIGLWTSGINLLLRSSCLWPRPELYASGADLERGEAWGSFYSGHTSAAFALAVFSGMWYDAKNPNSPYAPLVWSVSLSAAASVGVLRIWAGKHYPTDVLAGALVGSLGSFAVLQLHRSSRVSLVALPGYLGASVRF